MKATKVVKLSNVAPASSIPDLAAEYRRKDHDPLMLQTVMLLNASQHTLTRIVRKSGVSRTCLANWQNKKTKRPQAATLRFVLRTLGYEMTITPKR